MKKKFEFIFVALVYKDTVDIVEFIDSIKAKFNNYRIVIVNAHYDNETDEILETISKKYDCDIINICNGGYGYGNNRGIEYVKEKYTYEYLIIANPDTIVEYVNIQKIKKIKNGVIAPVIKNLNEKNQNPYWARKCDFGEWLIYKGYKLNNKIIRYIGYAINRIIRESYILQLKGKEEYIKEVYASHGSFVIFDKLVINELGSIYDENMFMFAEEADLAHKLRENGIKTYYTNHIRICHKEDGCINKSSIDENKIAKDSVIYYYEKYKRNKK